MPIDMPWPGKAVNSERLAAELRVAGVPAGVPGVYRSGDRLVIAGEVSEVHRAAAERVVAAHVAPAPETPEKRLKREAAALADGPLSETPSQRLWAEVVAVLLYHLNEVRAAQGLTELTMRQVVGEATRRLGR